MSRGNRSSSGYESLIEDTSNSSAKEAMAKPKNWPKCKPILRHNIKEDIPLELQTMTHLMLFDCFYTAFVLIFNFFVVFMACFIRGDDSFFDELVFSFIWFVVWTIGCFAFYCCLYRAISKQSRKCYIVFILGVIAEAITSVIAAMGISGSGIMSFSYAISIGKDPLFGFFGFITTIAFTLNVIFLVAYFFMIRSMYKKVVTRNRIVIEDGIAIAPRIGSCDSLPSDIDGREIRYLPLSAGSACDSKVESLAALPEDSFTVISEWKKMDANLDDSYILYAEGDIRHAYWSNQQVAGILSNGVVNPVTQVLTISRLPGGSFAFGVMDKD